MIDLLNETAGTKSKPIVKWGVVFFVAPFGVFTEVGKAITKAAEHGLDPAICVIPLAAAYTEDEMELVYR
jgi:hypothetical protein